MFLSKDRLVCFLCPCIIGSFLNWCRVTASSARCLSNLQMGSKFVFLQPVVDKDIEISNGFYLFCEGRKKSPTPISMNICSISSFDSFFSLTTVGYSKACCSYVNQEVVE